jgi:hypothetical protein
LTAEAAPDLRAMQGLSVPQFCDRFSEREVAFPSFRIDVTAGPEFSARELELQQGKKVIQSPPYPFVSANQTRLMNRVIHVFQSLERNGKLSCPAPVHFGCISPDKPSQLIEAWDAFALKPRAPAQEVNFPRLEIALAASMLDKILPRTSQNWERKFFSVTSVAEALQRLGNVKRDSDRSFMQGEAEHLLTAAKIDCFVLFWSCF